MDVAVGARGRRIRAEGSPRIDVDEPTSLRGFPGPVPVPGPVGITPFVVDARTIPLLGASPFGDDDDDASPTTEAAVRGAGRITGGASSSTGTTRRVRALSAG